VPRVLLQGSLSLPGEQLRVERRLRRGQLTDEAMSTRTAVGERKRRRVFRFQIGRRRRGRASQLGPSGGKVDVVLADEQRTGRDVKPRGVRRSPHRLPQDTLAHVVTTLDPV